MFGVFAVLCALFSRYAQGYLSDSFAAKCTDQFASNHRAACECVVRSLARVSEQQMSVAQYMYIVDQITGDTCQSKCNVLVFGVGGDSPIWMHANRHGHTVFVEQSEHWAQRARERSPGINVVTTAYSSSSRATAHQMNDLDARYWDFLPADVSSRTWHVVLIDAPTAYDGDQPGRLQPVWFTARHVAETQSATHVFLHDYERPDERKLGQAFFTLPFRTQPVVVSSPIRPQHLAHWALLDSGNIRNALARSLRQKHFLVGGQRSVILNVLSTGENETDTACARDMRRQSSVTFRENSPADGVVSVDLESEEDGLGEPIASGSYLQMEQFRRAVIAKTYVVLSALRFSYAVLLVDIDVFATAKFNLDELFAVTSTAVPFAAQQDQNKGECVFSPNSGFYLSLPTTSAARHLQRVARVSVMQRITEQMAWAEILADQYGDLFSDQCTAETAHAAHNGSLERNRPVSLLNAKLYPNGAWILDAASAGTLPSALSDARILHFNYIVGMCEKWKTARKVLQWWI